MQLGSSLIGFGFLVDLFFLFLMVVWLLGWFEPQVFQPVWFVCCFQKEGPEGMMFLMAFGRIRDEIHLNVEAF